MSRADPGRIALGAFTGLVFVLLYGPIAVPVVASFFPVAQGRIDWSSPTLDSYRLLAGNDSVLESLVNTLIVGFCASFLALVVGMGLALYHGWRRARGRAVLQGLVALPFLMPPIITGLALLIFFREANIDRSLATVVIGHTCFVLALVYRTLLVRLEQLSASLVEASYDLGASGWQTFRLVLLPNLTSSMVGAVVLAFALSFDETMISLLVTGTASTLPVRLWGMMRLGFTPDINALVTLILAFTAVLCLAAARTLFPAASEGRA
jgi:putative spermidine/putrescine transport system permease protein/spermidine/putrescine transport system permease protein